MRPARLSITTKLAAINLLLAAALLAVVAVAWRHLPSSTQAGEAGLLGRAQRATQHADMLHDALHADVLAALLAGPRDTAAHTQVRRALQEDAQGFRTAIAELQAMPLGTALAAPLAPTLQEARTRGLAYVEAAEALVALALSDPAAAMARRPAFDAAFEAAKAALAAQTQRVAESLDAVTKAAESASEAARTWLLFAGLVTVTLGWAGVGLIARSIRRSLTGLRDVAQAVAAGDLERRSDLHGPDEVGQLAGAVNRMAHELHGMISRMRRDADRTDFGARLIRALDMADREAQAHEVVARAMQQVAPDRPMELLLADSSDAHLERAASHPTAGAPGCGVESPFSCLAVRRGHAVAFPDSEALDACPRLRGRASGAISASCVPVTFMGRALGVLHATGPVGQPFDDEALDRLVTLGTQVGGRIGTVRAFERTQRQAATDALTGLPNRRTAETRLRELCRGREPFAFAMADLDHFKILNDTHGHQAGDEALRAFADVARECTGAGDLACRWGGEEFAFVLIGADGEQALAWTRRLRERLAETLRRRSAPHFTASFGVSVAAADLPTEAMVAAADVALYRAKAEGRDRAVLSVPAVAGGALPTRISEQAAAIDPRRMAETA